MPSHDVGSMSSIATTALTISLASFVVALGIDALTPGGAGAAVELPTQTPTTTTVPVRQDQPEPIEPGKTEIYAETDEQLELADWALGRFEEAGLELPPITIHVHADRSGCNGRLGYLGHADGGQYVIHQCGTEFTLLHELAHAWDVHALTEEIRQEFLTKAHATQWNNPDNWYLAGGEHAANVIAWALMEERGNQTQTRPYDHASMLDGFRSLTGIDPLWMSATASSGGE